MRRPIGNVRSTIATAVLIGWAVVLASALRADAASCHVDERPIFGLSGPIEPFDRPAPADSGIEDDGHARVLPRPCPADPAERTTGSAPLERDLSSLSGEIADPPSFGLLRAEQPLARPILRRERVDRPPKG